jgi:hypothetical protein
VKDLQRRKLLLTDSLGRKGKTGTAASCRIAGPGYPDQPLLTAIPSA